MYVRYGDQVLGRNVNKLDELDFRQQAELSQLFMMAYILVQCSWDVERNGQFCSSARRTRKHTTLVLVNSTQFANSVKIRLHVRRLPLLLFTICLPIYLLLLHLRSNKHFITIKRNLLQFTKYILFFLPPLRAPSVNHGVPGH